ncbi:uncharacterized protein LOC121524905 isoform X2 [Cheilinus undulatus]|uniref:uncharacterized protein LOC121524905 isoform X2 n=1 Tax=Cheilinus undulatus TaxID=241271 RepID=UPI001BD247C4|nr:uncharacterized protein LOC121524905 isoform X2 [Cheilinus undulatus]
MASSPFIFIPERHWTEEKERALIAFFSKHSCLWNHKTEGYKNRQLRLNTLEHLRVLLSAHPPPVRFTIEDIKNKFRNLRTTFQRQHKLVKESEACSSADVYVPQWKHYQQLMFLQDLQGSSLDQEDGQDEPPLSPPMVQEDDSKPVVHPQGLIISFLPNQPTIPSSPSSSSSCVPTDMTMKSFWTEEKERALIAFYSEHSCLWNRKSEKHNNRQLRSRLLENLRSQLSDNTVPFSVEDIKAKFKNLRTVFNREYKTVQSSRVYDNLYMSKWKHYQQMLFLCEACDEDDNQDCVEMLAPLEDEEHGNTTTSSILSSISSSSTHANSIKFISSSAPSNDKINHSTAYQIFLPQCPDNLKIVNHKSAPTLPLSRTTSPPDIKPSIAPSTLTFSTSSSVHTDSLQTTDSRIHWNEAKVRQLISFYSAHSCLWNHKSESYKNRLLRQSLLKMLSNILSDHESVPFTVEDIKTKFRNLRTTFQREHKAVNSNQTCGSEDFYVPKWKHYNDLMFLCDSCDEDDRPEEVHYIIPQEPPPLRLDNHAPPTALHYHTPTQTEARINIPSQSREAPPSPTPPDSQRSSPSSSSACTSPSSRTESRVSGRKRASFRPPGISKEVLDFMRTLCQSQVASPHAGFLKYVEECLNETPPDKVKKLKKTIIETIHSASEES